MTSAPYFAHGRRSPRSSLGRGCSFRLSHSSWLTPELPMPSSHHRLLRRSLWSNWRETTSCPMAALWASILFPAMADHLRPCSPTIRLVPSEPWFRNKMSDSGWIEPGVSSPIERTLRVVRSEAGAIAGIALQRPGEDEDDREATSSGCPRGRVHERRRHVGRHTFDASHARAASSDCLVARLRTPQTVFVRSLYALLRFLGLAVLIYDKRGTGGSTGTFFPRTAFYPEPSPARCRGGCEVPEDTT